MAIKVAMFIFVMWMKIIW